MKKTKVIIPALGILLLSTAASVTGTVAWFSANTVVSATDMKVKAEAQQGIVIANTTGVNATYSYTAKTANTDLSSLKPVSTWNCSDWYYSVSNDPAQANTGGKYTAVTASDKAQYYAEHDFYIRSSTGDAITNQKIVMQNVTVKVGDAAPTQTLSASLRVGFLIAGDETAYIFAPVSGYSASYNVHQSSDNETGHTKAVAPTANTSSLQSAAVTIPANSAQGINVKVFIWFEGEDAKCISNNLVANDNLEQITASVEFSHVTAA